jgi:hypothetical protein
VEKTLVLMSKYFSFFLFVFLLLLGSVSQAQRIRYSEIERDDYRQMNFEIIGKVGGNIQVYKNYRNKNDLSVYDDDMKLKNKLKLEFMPERVVNVDFVTYQDFFYMIYQYQKKNIVHCTIVKLDGEGKILTKPYDLDTTQISSFGDNKVYAVVSSDDEQKIMIFKVNKRDEKRYVFNTFLYNSNLELLKSSRLTMPVQDREGVFTEFSLDNEGNLVFGRCGRGGSREYINRLDIALKQANEDTFRLYNVPLKDKTLDEVKIKVDNAKNRIIASSFFYKQRKGNIEGLYNIVLDKTTFDKIVENSFVFNDTLRADAKSDNSSMKMAFNDYFIKHLIPKKDGGFAVLGELYYTTSRSTGWNRWDYLYGYNTFTPLDYWYYSPYSSYSYWRWWDPWNRWNSYSSTRHYYENVIIFSFDQSGNLEWSNFVRKTQYDDNTDMFLSYQLYNTGGEVHFLYNQLERREMLLNDQTISPRDGQVKRNPTLRGLDKGYEFMPRFGKQVAAKQIVIPCMYKNYICFAKLDY